METTPKQPKTSKAEINAFFQSPFVKLAFMTILILFLLIPLSSVHQLIKERKGRQLNFQAQLNKEWGGQVDYYGFALRIPQVRSGKHTYLYPASEKDVIHTNVKRKHRGIYSSPIYSASFISNAQFDWEQIREKYAGQLDWSKAQLCLITDKDSRLTALNSLTCNDRSIEISGSEELGAKRIFYAPVSPPGAQVIKAHSEISVNGNSQLTVHPVAREYSLILSSNWQDPAFEGSLLPAATIPKQSKGFTSRWKSLEVPGGRNTAHSSILSSTAATVRFMEPVDFYQLNERTIKYGILVLSLTFAVFFLIELTYKLAINPIHYVLIGLGLMLFYLLLLSFSEQIGFIGAYCIAGFSIITLIGWYSRSILRSVRFSALISAALVLLYTFLIVIVHLEVYALIAGSVGLLVVLFLIMNVTRKLKYTPTT